MGILSYVPNFKSDLSIPPIYGLLSMVTTIVLSIPPIYTTYRYRLFYYTILISRQPWELHHIDIDYCTITTDGIYITYLYHLFCTVIGARFGTARPQATDHMAWKSGGKSSIDGQERYSEMAMVISYNWIYMGLYIFDMG